MPTSSIERADTGAAIGGRITGGTDGSVLFVGTGGTIGQDNATFFWDDSSNELGIGVTGSGVLSKLHVAGTIPYFILDNITATQGFIAMAAYNTTGNVSILYGPDKLTFESQAYSNRGTASGGTTRLHLSSTGQLGINLGSTAPATGLDVLSTSGQIRFGDVATDATTKTTRWGSRHYTNSEEDIILAFTQSTSSVNNVSIGGGSSLHNAATVINFYTGANNTTVTGTLRASIDSTGKFGVGKTGTQKISSADNISWGASDEGILTWSASASASIRAMTGAVLNLESDGGLDFATLDASGNFGIGTTTFGTNAAKVFALVNGTAPTTSPADTVQLFSADAAGAGTASLGIRTEVAVATESVTSDRTLQVTINGTVYKICLKA